MKKKVAFYLSDEEYQYISIKAQECNCSVNAYLKRKALDQTDSIRLQNEAGLLMADLYYWSELTEDMTIRAFLKEGGDRLCRCLRW